ncbi:MAG: alanine racemase [Clostridia bacterium]|nr:alanine racemase [Clostridia bacterium]
MEHFKRTWAEIDLSAVGENFHTVRRQVGDGVKVMAVVKADAYGHGVSHVVPYLDDLGADFFGVSCLQEAMELRRLQIKKPILILGYTPAKYFSVLAEQKISQTVFSMEDAKELSRISTENGQITKIHAALDTGMGRIGFDAFDPHSAADQVRFIANLPGLELEGIFTHFSVADTDGEEAYTEAQFDRFLQVRALLEKEGLHPLAHASNSAGTFLNKKYHLDMVRAGIVLYGLEPGGRENPFRPAMTVKTLISFVKEVPAGRDISYGRHYTTTAPTRIATLSAGYADGYPRRLSGKGYALIHGKKAPILGNVCMDQLMVDVSDIPCKAGEEAVLMGGGIDFNLLADQLGTIHYELICGVGKRVPRIVK